MRSRALLTVIASVILIPAISCAQTTTKTATRYTVYQSQVLSFEGARGIIPIRSVSGGFVQGKVVEQLLADGSTQKRIGGIITIPLTFESGLSGTLLPWVADSLQQPGVIARNARVSLLDAEYRERSARVLENAIVSRVSFPALDASAKSAAYVTLELRPRSVSYRDGSGSALTSISRTSSSMMAANFRLEIDGLPTGSVRRIEPLTWTLPDPGASAIGDSREYETAPSPASIGSLKLHADMSDIEPWHDWYESSVIKGNTSETSERNGRLSLLSADLSRSLLDVELGGLGIFSLQQTPAEANADTLNEFTVELYVQRIAISR